MREYLITELVRNILGPSGGCREVLDISPLDKYITGVLAPLESVPSEDAELGYGNVPPVGEDEEFDEDAAGPPLLEPALSPQKRPSTMGIRFMVRSQQVPRADICLTWARYFESDPRMWVRHPRYCIIRDAVLSVRTVEYIGEGGKKKGQDEAELCLYIIPQKKQQGRWVVSLYLVNAIRAPPHPRVEHHIFQPQIRVRCRHGTETVPLESSEFPDREERVLAYLHRKRAVKAIGVLCSAVWREIDPQRPFGGELQFPEVMRHPPFGWPDGELLESKDLEEFADSDVRSEFTPLCVDPMPEVDKWPEEYGGPPELCAERLAQLFDPVKLREALLPLIEGYRKWIEQQDWTGAGSGDTIVGELKDSCEKALKRMKLGLRLLEEDADARLAFCFANKAMDLQARWGLNGPLRWRPFQLGFILCILESVANPQSPDRDILDLLWVPTGTGKTEAYLFLILFILALRRRRALRDGRPEEGTAVITRYTLRLLTIQQFRRLLRAITAAECLRVEGLPRRAGWLPEGAPPERFPWGVTPFTVGLWIGGGVTPNRLDEAIKILQMGRIGEQGEPAQVTHCPACGSILAIPRDGIAPPFILHLVVQMCAGAGGSLPFPRKVGEVIHKIGEITIKLDGIHSVRGDISVLSLKFEGREKVRGEYVEELGRILQEHYGIRCLSVSASRPGYFLRKYSGRMGPVHYNFEIICPAPPGRCPLQQKWCAGSPSGSPEGSRPGNLHNWDELNLAGREGYFPVEVQEIFRDGHECVSGRVPIPALTVDEQVYHWLPSVVIATVDKFARPPFEPRAGAIWGNVTHYHPIWGYYREGLAPHSGCSGGKLRYSDLSKPVQSPEKPELIIQDELHLLDGPLGSLAGFYETVVDFLAGGRAKYIACSATVRNATYQAAALFCRRVAIFPPPGPDIEDRFFVRIERMPHPLEEECRGRVYLGVCAPGRGPHTPQVRIWSHLLHATRAQPTPPASNPYLTLVGYFNSIRELAGARALYRQDIPEYLAGLGSPAVLPEEGVAELWRNTPSEELPWILEWLSSDQSPPDALFATSMFGTGVDITRLSLMVVNGQPKSTSSYIQATGRVGRRRGALVVTFYRATRPRDLSHYESFCGYHLQLHRFVEPVTVNPFSVRLVEDFGGGPLAVFLLRCFGNPSLPWHEESGAHLMAQARNSPEVTQIAEIVAQRAERCRRLVPELAANPDLLRERMKVLLDAWHNIARNIGRDLCYAEQTLGGVPRRSVVLGDPAHREARRRGANIFVVYPNAPQSLREVEGTCAMGLRGWSGHVP
jgi:hypothetical protein